MTEADVAGEEPELGPIDFVVIEYPNGRPTGEALPYLLDLVDRQVIHILDVALIAKSADGDSFQSISLSDLAAAESDGFGAFDGAASGMIDDDDLEQVAAIIGPGSAAAILVYENSWAGPFAAAVRRAGGQLVSTGRIPVQSILAALEEAEAE